MLASITRMAPARSTSTCWARAEQEGATPFKPICDCFRSTGLPFKKDRRYLHRSSAQTWEMESQSLTNSQQTTSAVTPRGVMLHNQSHHQSGSQPKQRSRPRPARQRSRVTRASRAEHGVRPKCPRLRPRSRQCAPAWPTAALPRADCPPPCSRNRTAGSDRAGRYPHSVRRRRSGA